MELATQFSNGFIFTNQIGSSVWELTDTHPIFCPSIKVSPRGTIIGPLLYTQNITLLNKEIRNSRSLSNNKPVFPFRSRHSIFADTLYYVLFLRKTEKAIPYSSCILFEQPKRAHWQAKFCLWTFQLTVEGRLIWSSQSINLGQEFYCCTWLENTIHFKTCLSHDSEESSFRLLHQTKQSVLWDGKYKSKGKFEHSDWFLLSLDFATEMFTSCAFLSEKRN